MLAFYRVLLRDQHGARLVERQLVERDLGVVVERMRKDENFAVPAELRDLRVTAARVVVSEA